MRWTRHTLRTRACIVGAAFFLGTFSLGGSAPASAAASDVAEAKARVDSMQATVQSVAARLDKGTRAYLAGQRQLAKVVLQEDAARRRVQEALALSAAEREKLDRLAAAAYRRPLPDLVATMMGRPEDFATALVAQADLEHVSGSQKDVLRRVTTARVRSESLSRAAELLSAEARATERRLASQLEELRAVAESANQKLQAADAELEKARAAERARLEARERASRAAASRARARLAAMRTGSCQGDSQEDYANGFMPASALCSLWRAPGQQLRRDAGRQFLKMSEYRAATAGRPLCVTDAYRSYARQVSVYQRKPALAATPGSSEHGWGKALDLCGGVESFNSEAYQWMKANAGRFGFFHPDWAEPYGSMPEPWHWEFSG